MQLQTVDIGKTASAAAIVFKALRKAIIEGSLKDGDPLKQDEIARLFNTSRIPVREALTMLEQQGLVKTQRYKGAFVANLSLEEAGEIFDLRILLEGTLIERAVPKMTEETFQEAQIYISKFSNSDDPMIWGEANRNFHNTLYRASGLTYHLEVIDRSLDRIDRYIRAQVSMSDGVAKADEEHIAILKACKERDAKTASDLTKKHIEGVKASLARYLK